MTASEAIAWIDEKKHNIYTREDKLGWLLRLEQTAAEFMGRYEGEVMIPETLDWDTPLIIPAPFEDLYLYHLEAQMDYCNQELTKYNNAAAMFGARWEAFTGWYNRNHLYKSAPARYF